MRTRKKKPIHYASLATGKGLDSPLLKKIKKQTKSKAKSGKKIIYGYTDKDLKQLEQQLSTSDCSIRFLHQTQKKYQAIEEHIQIAPVALLQHNESENKILGVYAKTNVFNQNSSCILGEYLGEKLATQDTDADPLANFLYSFDLENGYEINALQQRSWLAMVNSASAEEAANIIVLRQKDKILYQQTKPIRQGEQFLVYYGDAYVFENRRFLNPNNNWKESEELIQEFHHHYRQHQDIKALQALCALPDHMVFALPDEETLDEACADLPILAYDTVQQKYLKQSQQDNMSALHYACWQGNLQTIAKLIALGANVYQQMSIQGYSLSHCILLSPYHTEKQKIKLLAFLAKDYPAILRLQDKNENSVLHLAVEQGSIAVVLYLLQQDPQLRELVNQQDLDFLSFIIISGSLPLLEAVLPHLTTEEIIYCDELINELAAYITQDIAVTYPFLPKGTYTMAFLDTCQKMQGREGLTLRTTLTKSEYRPDFFNPNSPDRKTSHNHSVSPTSITLLSPIPQSPQPIKAAMDPGRLLTLFVPRPDMTTIELEHFMLINLLSVMKQEGVINLHHFIADPILTVEIKITALQLLYNHLPAYITQQNADGYSILHTAIDCHLPQVVMYLLHSPYHQYLRNTLTHCGQNYLAHLLIKENIPLLYAIQPQITVDDIEKAMPFIEAYISDLLDHLRLKNKPDNPKQPALLTILCSLRDFFYEQKNYISPP